jgi:alkanesulfonate monooxygenase SsuD/methylene tetrahydromethanopterin reductase-like flavin-dependent oxidoreductase (luciferase family)
MPNKLSIGVALAPAMAFSTVTVADVRPFARYVDELGLDAVFVPDHLEVPCLESMTTLATVAAVTERIKLGFGVLVLPLRQPAWVAKQVATLQLLSGNRIILGVGVGGSMHGMSGWEATGTPYAERGRRTDAALALLPRLIAGEPVMLDSGEQLTLAPGAEVPPIWVGGDSEAALRRAVVYGSAWYTQAMVLPDEVARCAQRLAELSAELGRPTPDVVVGATALLGSDASPSVVDDFTAMLARGLGVPPEQARALPILGSAARAAERFTEYARVGASSVVLRVIGGDWRQQCDLIAEARGLVGTI